MIQKINSSFSFPKSLSTKLYNMVDPGKILMKLSKHNSRSSNLTTLPTIQPVRHSLNPNDIHKIHVLILKSEKYRVLNHNILFPLFWILVSCSWLFFYRVSSQNFDFHLLVHVALFCLWASEMLVRCLCFILRLLQETLHRIFQRAFVLHESPPLDSQKWSKKQFYRFNTYFQVKFWGHFHLF